MSNSSIFESPYLHPELRRKLDTIGSIFIRHDGILEGWEVLERTYHVGFRVNEATTGYIYGHSRCGKTELAHRFIKQLTGTRPIRGPVCQFVEGNGLRIVYLDLTNGSSPLPATIMLLRLFRDIKANSRLSQPDATSRLIDNLLLHRPDMLFVDEAQQAFRGDGTYSVNALGEWLLPLQNARACRSALIGSPKLDRLFKTVEAARERHGGIAYLDPFSFKTEIDISIFRTFLRMFFEKLPFAKTCIVNDDGTVNIRRASDIYYSSRGGPGGVANLCEAATCAAFRRAAGAVPTTLELSDFAGGFDFLYRHDVRMKGVNPFLADDRKSIPAIPLTPDEEEDPEEKPKPKGNSKQSKVGGRIHA
ncbi:ATP-binding protein [Bradyrhizobium barranii subsp. barranii]|uniref:ATP-binding protein n=1 Tax=Bradyrhizobium barranii subsp. barranii TaxID=2823807 RepID=A0A939MBA5_9BRAD|nr:ATP-binding protein [Bradyrhizobium barranii]UEM08390.1 ATP-binding protein [Bradyrhizobium barranii subsp. barranii]